MQSIINNHRFIKAEPITKGWSHDKKYCVTDKDGQKFFLRTSSLKLYENCKAIFEIMKRVEEIGVPMCVPIELGTCGDEVYMLQSWVEGDDLLTVLPSFTARKQYELGLEAGRILKKIHTIPAPELQEDWASRFGRKTNFKIKAYHECELKFEGDTYVLEYIENNRHLLECRRQCFQYGDYHIGNIMCSEGKLVIIDFDRYDFGEPWEEFNRINLCAEASPHFATGRIHGYFDGEPPLEFFQLLAFYTASNALSSLPWAIPFGQEEVDTMMKQAQNVHKWFSNMQSPIPTWYFTQKSRL